MPTYEYKCEDCGKVFEVLQKISESPLTQCPESVCDRDCKGQGKVHRIISKNIGLVFNGKGFYLTDYTNRNSSAATKTNVEKPAAKPAESKVETKSA